MWWRVLRFKSSSNSSADDIWGGQGHWYFKVSQWAGKHFVLRSSPVTFDFTEYVWCVPSGLKTLITLPSDRTRNRSHSGIRWGRLDSSRDRDGEMSPRRLLSENTGPPNWRIVVEIADLYPIDSILYVIFCRIWLQCWNVITLIFFFLSVSLFVFFFFVFSSFFSKSSWSQVHIYYIMYLWFKIILEIISFHFINLFKVTVWLLTFSFIHSWQHSGQYSHLGQWSSYNCTCFIGP
jgi:hypothetical protein